MSYSIMEAMFDGKLTPWEWRGKLTSERKELEAKIRNAERYFTEKMSSDDCKRFEALGALYCESSQDDETEIYARSFTLGALLMLEIMVKKDEIILK